MYLRQLYIENNGPLRRLSLELPVTSGGAPIPVIVVGENGSGKTNLLSIIADALFEAAAAHYTNVLPSAGGVARHWFRISGGATTSAGASGQCAILRFEHDGKDYFYAEKAGSLDPAEVRARLPESVKFEPRWQKTEAFKSFPLPGDLVEAIFEGGAYVYFPSSRSEVPHWLNTGSLQKEAFDTSLRVTKNLRKPVYVEQGLDQLKQWLLSLMLDVRVPVSIDPPQPNNAGHGYSLQVEEFGALQVMSRGLWTQLNGILKTILNTSSARFQWMGRHAKSVGIRSDTQQAPVGLDGLSAGQATLLNVFGTLLRYGDRELNTTAEQISGICLIDEIDAHMHLDLQYRALPVLIGMFPKVQFIVSSHSPLHVLGMEKAFGVNSVAVIDMPSGTRIQTEAYSEFSRAFEVFKTTEAFNKAMLDVAQQSHKLLVLLEGDTDERYLTAAAQLLGRNSLLEHVEFKWVGTMDPTGQHVSNTGKEGLNSAFCVLRANPQLVKRKVLLLYDCDANKPDETRGDLYVRSIPQNGGNTKVKVGIENLLPESLFTPDRFERTEKVKDDGSTTVVTRLDKRALCDDLCTRARNTRDFAGFSAILDMIDEIARPHNAA